MLLFLLACSGTSKPDSNVTDTSDSGTIDTADSTTDSVEDSDSSQDSDSGQDSDTTTDSGTTDTLPLWNFSDQTSVVTAIEAAPIPGYITGLIENWVKYGPDSPNCPTITDQGGGTFVMDATSCTMGVEGMVTVSGLSNGQLPIDGPVSLSWSNFGTTSGLYSLHKISGDQILTKKGDGTTRVQSSNLSVTVDPVAPRLLPAVGTWGGEIVFDSLDATDGPFHSYGSMSGSYHSPLYGSASVSYNYKYTPGSCEKEGFYYPAAGLWTGAQKLDVEWDGDSNCDGCVPYTVDGVPNSICI